MIYGKICGWFVIKVINLLIFTIFSRCSTRIILFISSGFIVYFIYIYLFAKVNTWNALVRNRELEPRSYIRSASSLLYDNETLPTWWLRVLAVWVKTYLFTYEHQSCADKAPIFTEIYKKNIRPNGRVFTKTLYMLLTLTIKYHGCFLWKVVSYKN